MMHGKLSGNFVGCSRDDVFSVCDSVTKELLPIETKITFIYILY